MVASKILVVDDSSTVRTLVRRILVRAGYEVVLAADGVAGLDVARNEPPDLAILDINMPELDGYGVCQELRRMGTPWTDIPIVFLSGVESRALQLLGAEMGGYLHKPVKEADLLQMVYQFLPAPTGAATETTV